MNKTTTPSTPTSISPDQTKDFLPSYRSVIRVTPRAHATLSHRNQDTRDEEPCGLTDQEQEILNDYATKAAFHLTGIANGQLLKENIEDMAYTADIDDVFDQLQELIVDASVLSEELSARLTRRVNVDDWIPDDWNSTLSVTIDSCIQTAKLLIESIIDPPEPEGPEVPDHPDSPE